MDQYKFDMETLRSFCDANFESDKTKSLLGSFITHLAKSPDDVGGWNFAWLFDCMLQDYGNKTVKGGMGNLSKALASVFTLAGGEIFTNAGVKKIVTENKKATNVILENGDSIKVKELVASSVDPKALILDMLGEESVGKEITEKVRTYEWGRSNMVMFMALDRPLEYKAGENVANAPAMHLSEPSLDGLSAIAVECNAGLLPTTPFILIHNESATDPTRAPEGMGLIRFIVFSAPYHLRGDARGEIKSTNWDDAKEAFADRVIDMVNRDYITNLKDAISARVVYSPVDQERKLSSSVEGTMLHGTMVPYQSGILRPIPEFGGYKSPIENLYLCGSSSHPGAAVSFIPGRNAAGVILKDRGLELPTG
jgi:phytoene dehydrogenase-like protein